MRSAFEGVDDALGLDDQIITASDHVRRGEVALDTAVGLDVLGDPFGADAVVDGDAVCTRRFGKSDIPIACFAREGNHGGQRTKCSNTKWIRSRTSILMRYTNRMTMK